MENKPRTDDLDSLISQPEKFLAGLPREKLMLFKVEIIDLKENYNRGTAISFVNGNFTSNKHLSLTLLNGMTDEKVKSVLDDLYKKVEEELNKPRE